MEQQLWHRIIRRRFEELGGLFEGAEHGEEAFAAFPFFLTT